MYGNTKTLGITMNKIISFNTKLFSYKEMLDYFFVTERIPEFHLQYFMNNEITLSKQTKNVLSKLNIYIADGGWCNFITNNINKIYKQLNIIQYLKINNIRLFFGNYPKEKITNKEINKVIFNIKKILRITPPKTNLLFETHKGIGTNPDIVKHILKKVNTNNIGLVFDPINIIRDNEDPIDMIKQNGKYIKHIHLKGLSENSLCEFGKGIDITQSILKASEFTNSFGIEYESEELNIKEGLEKSYNNFKQFCEKEKI